MFNQFTIEEREFNNCVWYVPFRNIFGMKFAIASKNGKFCLKLLDTGCLYKYIVDAYGVIAVYAEEKGLNPMITNERIKL